MTATRIGAFLLLTAILVTGCGGSSDEEPPRSQGVAESQGQSSDDPATSTQHEHDDEGHEAPVEEVPEPSPGVIATGAPRTVGRSAPPVASGPLAFTKVFVARSERGTFELRANARNRGRAFLNDAEVAWSVLAPDGSALAEGEVAIASLAPGETASIVGASDAGYDAGWARVVLEVR